MPGRIVGAGGGGLPAHLDGFVRAVRGSGIPVGISAAVDAAQVLTVVDLLDREQLRHGLAAVLLQRAATPWARTSGGRSPRAQAARASTSVQADALAAPTDAAGGRA